MNVTFDWNEWFFILTSAIVILLFLPIRKYFPPVLVIIIWVYNLALVATIDYFLLATPFRMYIFGDNPTYELSGALFHFFMYPCSALIFYLAMTAGNSMARSLFGTYWAGVHFPYSLNGLLLKIMHSSIQDGNWSIQSRFIRQRLSCSLLCFVLQKRDLWIPSLKRLPK